MHGNEQKDQEPRKERDDAIIALRDDGNRRSRASGRHGSEDKPADQHADSERHRLLDVGVARPREAQDKIAQRGDEHPDNQSAGNAGDPFHHRSLPIGG
jgi:hypothetical protein